MFLHKQWRQFIFWNKWSGYGRLAAPETRRKGFRWKPTGIGTRGWQPTVLPVPGTKAAPKERCHSGDGAGRAPVPTLCHKSVPSPNPCRGRAHWHLPSGGVAQEGPRAANCQQNIPGAFWLNSSDCSPGKVLPLGCNYSVNYENLFLGMNSAEIWLVDQIPWVV